MGGWWRALVTACLVCLAAISTAGCLPPAAATPSVPTDALWMRVCFPTLPVQRLGWRAVDVPFYEWYDLASAQRKRYMRRKLRQAGLQLPELRQQQEEGDSQPAEQHPQPQLEEEPLHLDAAPLPMAVSASPHEQQQQQQDGEAGTSGAPAVSVVQRAQRLHMLQYRAGKLSRQGLLSRRSMQAASGGGAGSTAAPGGGSSIEGDSAPGGGDNAAGADSGHAGCEGAANS